MNHKDRDRLGISVVGAVVVHAVLLAIGSLIPWSTFEDLPDYSGPIYVELAEVPVMTKADRPADAEPQPEQQPKPEPEPEPEAQPQSEPQAQPEQQRQPARASQRRPSVDRDVQAPPARTPESEPTPQPETPRLPSPREDAESARPAETEPEPEPTPPPQRDDVEPVEEYRPTPAPVEKEAEPYQESGEATGTFERRASPPVTAEEEEQAPEEGGMFSDRLAELDRAAARAPDTSDTETDRTDQSTGSGEPLTADSSARASGSSDDASEVEIEWNEPAEGRDFERRVEPEVPDVVKDEGLTVTAVYAFVLTPEGLLTQLTLQKSSGYSEVDIAAKEALRRWKFRQIQGTKQVKGSVRITMSATKR